MTTIMAESQPFITGESDPADFTVDQVVTHLATASPQEVQRVQNLEASGKGRKGILDADLEEAQEAVYQEAVADLLPERPEVGDTYQVDVPGEGGQGAYTAVVVSVD